MLAVIGLWVRFASVNDTDAFDYHLYNNESISLLRSANPQQLVDDAKQVIKQLVTVNHLLASDVHLVIVDEIDGKNSDQVQETSQQSSLERKPSLSEQIGLETDVFSVTPVLSTTQALRTAQHLCSETTSEDRALERKAVIILSVNQQGNDGVAALLVCDKTSYSTPLLSEPAVNSPSRQFSSCHCYAEINAISYKPLTGQQATVEEGMSQHIQDFISTHQLQDIESVFTGQSFADSQYRVTRSEHQQSWLSAFQSLSVEDDTFHLKGINKHKDTISNKAASPEKSTQLTTVECVNTDSANFDALLSLVAAVLCLDQRYRLGCKQSIVPMPADRSVKDENSASKADNVKEENFLKESSVKENNIENDRFVEWQQSPFYYLPHSTSYLSTQQTNPRQIIVSHIHHISTSVSKNVSNVEQTKQAQTSDSSIPMTAKLNSMHELISVSAATNKQNETLTVVNGFLAQQPLKPVIFCAPNIKQLTYQLKQVLLQSTATLPSKKRGTFTDFVTQQNSLSSDFNTLTDAKTDYNAKSYYCVVLLASSFSTLNEQIELALSGVVTAHQNNKPWKTPVGSYFCGQAITASKQLKPASFIYPGVGALYVNMGKDLLRLFPQCWQTLSMISDDLAHNLQDNLMTPRLVHETDFKMSVALEKSLRAELANIAEAGVSYACLLTAIFQQQLGIKATSAAGYSMGEVSMFAALDCWQTPQLMSQRFRESHIFTEQLSGPLKRLQSISQTSFNNDQWESYHLKAGILDVESVIDGFPGVYITIINTPESLVIAGDPKQCLALAKFLNLRAIALNVPNIIHCELAKSEYQNMLRLYSLAIKQKVSCQLFSSSCYLPVPVTEKAIAVSISKCLTELVDFPRLINKIAATGEHVFIEMGAGKSLSTWIERILKNNPKPITCLSVNQKNLDDYSAILKTIGPLLSLGYPINLEPFFNGSLIRPVKKVSASVPVSVL
ncbi:PfaB family protein [Psychromonas arctica]|uniref:PfaB family protein n=1 Tax=Psychromonas arctica TaxID=168275 RepID=UPI00040A3603|nr:PfaB family protein [Psychromonas arctica]